MGGTSSWVVKFLVFPKPTLQYNQYWDWQEDGTPLLVEMDHQTNKKSIVICDGGPTPPVVLFEAEIDMAKNSITVLKDTELTQLDGTKYEINRR